MLDHQARNTENLETGKSQVCRTPIVSVSSQISPSSKQKQRQGSVDTDSLKVLHAKPWLMQKELGNQSASP